MHLLSIAVSLAGGSDQNCRFDKMERFKYWQCYSSLRYPVLSMSLAQTSRWKQHWMLIC